MDSGDFYLNPSYACIGIVFQEMLSCGLHHLEERRTCESVYTESAYAV